MHLRGRNLNSFPLCMGRINAFKEEESWTPSSCRERFVREIALHLRWKKACSLWLLPYNLKLMPSCFKLAPKSIHQIAQFQFQKYKIFQFLFLRRHIPLRQPPVRPSRHLALWPPPPIKSPSKNVKDASMPLVRRQLQLWSWGRIWQMTL